MNADRRHQRIRLTTAEAPELLYAFAAMPQDIAAGAETWIQLFKVGDFYDWRYGDFSINAEHFERMVENFTTRAASVPGDYDHSFSKGEGSVSAGWTKAVEVRDGAEGPEMWGQVVLTERAAEQVRAGEYRFISPEFSLNHMNERGEAIGPCLLAWALTNRPFLEGMAEVTLAASRDGRVLARWGATARHDTTHKESEMDLVQKLRKALGLADDVSEEVILATVAQQHGLALSAPGKDSVVLSQEDAAQLRKDAEEGRKAQETLRLSQRDAALDKAITEGRLAPAARDQFAALYDASPEATGLALAALPVTPGFEGSKGGAAKDAPAGDDDTAPIGARIEARAQALMAETPTLALAKAYEKADAELRPAGKVA